MRQANRRIRLLVAVFALVFVAASARVAWLQAVRAQTLDRLATNQQREALVVPARRGTIFDRLGVQLALGERAVTVYANPKQVADPRAAALAAGRALEVDPGKLYPLLADRYDYICGELFKPGPYPEGFEKGRARNPRPPA